MTIMKAFFTLTLSLALFGAAAVQAEDAAKPEIKQQAKPARPEIKRTPPVLNAPLLAKYDKNKDGKLDESEREALRKDKQAEQKEVLKKYDKDNDGKLDAKERAAWREEIKKQHAPLTETPPGAPEKKADAPK